MSGTGWTSRLLVGLAEYLAADGIAEWSPTAAYTTTQTGIVIAAMPPAPNRVICLTDYPVTDRIDRPNVVQAVQIRCRAGADPREVADLADAVYDRLHGATGLMLGGIRVIQVRRQSYTRLPRDLADRHERSDNYYLDAWRPSAHRPH